MLRRLVVAAFFSILIHLVSGCAGSTKTFVGKEDVPQLPEANITQATLMNGQVLQFDRDGARYYERYKNKRRVIAGRTKTGESVTIALNDVRNVYIEKNIADEGSEAAFPTLLIMGIVVAVVINGSE
ncbi:MAG: hypothetical protein ACRENG_05645 [bacterium]